MGFQGLTGFGGGATGLSQGGADVVYTVATGGTTNDYTEPGPGKNYRAHIFLASGAFTVTSVGVDDTVEYLVIAGGGGGGSEGSNRGGGGGAGGYRTNAPAPIAPGNHTTSVTYPVSTSPGSYTVTIGGGGSGSPSGQGSDGSDSVFGTITSYRGGGGGQGSAASPPNHGRPGGSGGGGGSLSGGTATEPGGSTVAVSTPSPWPGPSTQGFAGGQGQHVAGSWAAGGGGGGAGEVGHAAAQPNPGTSSDGGDGLSNLIAGPNTSVGVVNPASPGRWFAGGGAGIHFSPGTGTGGAGGGGSTSYPGAGDNGVDGTGGGGASGSGGGQGGSGIVVVRYERGSATSTEKATGGSVSYYGGNTIHTFINSGTFVNSSGSPLSIEYVVVAGGGSGGGKDNGGGGGAGVI